MEGLQRGTSGSELTSQQSADLHYERRPRSSSRSSPNRQLILPHTRGPDLLSASSHPRRPRGPRRTRSGGHLPLCAKPPGLLLLHSPDRAAPPQIATQTRRRSASRSRRIREVLQTRSSHTTLVNPRRRRYRVRVTSRCTVRVGRAALQRRVTSNCRSNGRPHLSPCPFRKAPARSYSFDCFADRDHHGGGKETSSTRRAIRSRTTAILRTIPTPTF